MDATELASLSNEALDQQITQHAANINAANAQLLLLIAEFDRRRVWADHGARSCAHWLNARLGIASSAAREKVRVAHALCRLSGTRQAMESGALSYSKARAITRIGNDENETTLLNIAEHGTADQLERTVRLYRRQHDENGQFIVGENTPTTPPLDDSDETAEEGERRIAGRQIDHRRLDTRWDDYGCLNLTARLPPEQGAIVLKALDAAFESLDPPIEPASTNNPDDAEVSPASHVMESDGQCEARHRRNRRADALLRMAERFLESTTSNANSADRYQVVVHIEQSALTTESFVPEASTPAGQTPDDIPKTANTPDTYIENTIALPRDTARRLCCEAKLVVMLEDGGEPLAVGRQTRAVSPALHRAVMRRDQGCCTFPGCSAHRFLDKHHIRHWVDGGETSLANLTLVCRHHHRLLHEGGFHVDGQPGQLVWRRADGSAVEALQPADADAELVSAETPPWSWGGDQLDMSVALDQLGREMRRHVAQTSVTITSATA